ncbi:uncharacterized protein LOC116178922 [Photinus pyralis]|uniref:Uncharacterized protein n=1 Tax=Photinus pyralis TaxID=7054 RepID=A0A1Y1NHB7_PHOPY|nr:uncharacterized protein LOC116166705 [Photinus pyralis]XP_031338040.1 uncharacterized protein LOC116166958 [Photinus pyralis]XP_031345900.1 uncharacterized protein LOC116172772 [Photinus pyralis]XP_031345909.1 uncharacterized protein LOC116172782 [Photinus pyralis]XP_031349105.1 uncharacterized protein LOC116175136 [Photinus pyralis]XP_031354441.1 uncharacterized protein LOC116178922 [Photinus pyralis]
MSSRKSKLSLKKPAPTNILQNMLESNKVGNSSTCTDNNLFPHSPKKVVPGNNKPFPAAPFMDGDQCSVITIHSDNSTVQTPANLWENFDVELVMAQLDGGDAADHLYSSERVVPTPHLSEQQKSPTPPPEFRAPLPPLEQAGKSEDEPVDPRVCAKRRRKCGEKNLEALLKIQGQEAGYTPEMPSTSAVPIPAAREIASQAHQLLQKMLQKYAIQLQETQDKTSQLERQVEASRMEERKIEGDMRYILSFVNFCGRK